MRRLSFGLCLLFLGACEASFEDLRASSDKNDPASIIDAPDEGATRLRAGRFEGRAGHSGEGSVEVLRNKDGGLVLALGEDFVADNVPGPVLVLSYRESLGRRIDGSQGDVDLGEPRSLSGAQSYAIPAGTDDRLFAWVFCKPFGVEVARAALSEVP